MVPIWNKHKMDILELKVYGKYKDIGCIKDIKDN